MTITVTMLSTRQAQGGSLLLQDQDYALDDAFALELIGAGFAADKDSRKTDRTLPMTLRQISQATFEQLATGETAVLYEVFDAPGRPRYRYTAEAGFVPDASSNGAGLSAEQLSTLASVTRKLDADRLGVDVATLDGTGKVPASQLPSAVTGGFSYQGTWNASTNSPTLADGTGTSGWYRVVTTAGTALSKTWAIGDWAVYNGSTWDKIDNQAPPTTGYTTTLLAATSAAAARNTLGLATVANTGAYGDLSGRPTLGTAAALNAPASGNAAAGELVKGNDTRLASQAAAQELTEAAFDAAVAGSTLTANRVIRLTDKPGLHLARAANAADEMVFRRGTVTYIGEQPYDAPTDVDLPAGTWATRPTTGFVGGLTYYRRMTDRGPAPGNVHVWDGSGWVPAREKVVEITGSRSLAASDDDAVLVWNGTAACTITYPEGLSPNFRCRFLQANTGQISFAVSGAAVLRNRQSHTKSAGRGSEVILRAYGAIAGNNATLNGDTAA